MQFVDLALARRLEGIDLRAGLSCVEVFRSFRPELGAVAVEVGGGVAAFLGAGSPLTHALGIGMNGPVSDEDFDRLEAVFFDRGTACVLEHCPLADPSVAALLRSRGYRPYEFADVLYKPLGDEEYPPAPGIEVRVARPDEADLWADAVSEGFAGEPGVPEGLKDIARAMYRMPLATASIARIDGAIAGGGSLIVDGPTAAIAGSSTRPAHRGRGVHLALIQARLAAARRAGCDLAMMGALPNSGSHRNAERMGFRVAYTRVAFGREPGRIGS